MSIVEQLKSYCTCTDVSEELVAELVNVVSLATCWQRKPCETFLKAERTELIDLPLCMDCPMEFKPFYHPYDVDSFSFELIEVRGIEETSTEITSFQYSPTSELFRIDLGMECGCDTCECCECEPEYKLLVKYTAGYEELPDCLLPVFCNILEVLYAKNDCSCDDCGCDNSKYEEDNIQYATGDVVTVALETEIGKILVSQYMKQLRMISLCEAVSPVWGFVV